MPFISRVQQRFAHTDQRVPLGVVPSGHAILNGCCLLTFMNEGGGVKVFNLIDGKDGVLAGTTLPTWKNQYLNFTGGSGTPTGINFGATPQTADLALASASPFGFTMVARVRPDSNFSTSGGIARRNDGNSVNAGWEVICTTGGTLLSIERGTANLSAKTTVAIPSAGQWTTLAIVYFGDLTAANVLILYDGKPQAHTSDTNGSGAQGSDASQSMIIGESNYNNNSLNSGRFLGWMDWIGFWRRPLTYTEIYALVQDPTILVRPAQMAPYAGAPRRFPALTLAP